MLSNIGTHHPVTTRAYKQMTARGRGDAMKLRQPRCVGALLALGGVFLTLQVGASALRPDGHSSCQPKAMGQVVAELGARALHGKVTCFSGCKEASTPILADGTFHFTPLSRGEILAVVDAGMEYHPVPVTMRAGVDTVTIPVYRIGALSSDDAVKVLAHYSALYALTSLLPTLDRQLALESYARRLHSIAPFESETVLLTNSIRHLYTLDDALSARQLASTHGASDEVAPKPSGTLWEIPQDRP